MRPLVLFLALLAGFLVAPGFSANMGPRPVYRKPTATGTTTRAITGAVSGPVAYPASPPLWEFRYYPNGLPKAADRAAPFSSKTHCYRYYPYSRYRSFYPQDRYHRYRPGRYPVR